MEGMDNAMKKVYINTDATQHEFNDEKNGWLDLQEQHLKSLLDDLRSRIYYNMKSIAVFEGKNGYAKGGCSYLYL
jgi:hypothetical protein